MDTCICKRRPSSELNSAGRTWRSWLREPQPRTSPDVIESYLWLFCRCRVQAIPGRCGWRFEIGDANCVLDRVVCVSAACSSYSVVYHPWTAWTAASAASTARHSSIEAEQKDFISSHIVCKERERSSDCAVSYGLGVDGSPGTSVVALHMMPIQLSSRTGRLKLNNFYPPSNFYTLGR